MLKISNVVSCVVVLSHPAILFFSCFSWCVKFLEAFIVFLCKMHLPEKLHNSEGKKISAQFLHCQCSGFIHRRTNEPTLTD